MKAPEFLLLSFWIVASSLTAQVNLASKATLTTSYVSPWETLGALNDGFEPTSSGDHLHGAYGNWQDGVTNQWNWVQYTFAEYYKIARSDVYWWSDGGGIALPYNCYLQYWSISQNNWVKVNNPTDYGFKEDQYNATSFDTILTNKIRLNFVSLQSQGILEWKIYGEKGEQIPGLSTISIAPALNKGTTSTITAKAIQKNNLPVVGYVFKLHALVSKARAQDSEVYQINGQTITNSTENIALPPTDSYGKVVFCVTLPATINPTNGLEIKLNFNEGHTLFKSYSYQEPGMTAPVIDAEIASNPTDQNLELTFVDNSLWRNSITNILVDGTALAVNDYEISPGKIILKPSVGNKLSIVGLKTILIEAAGFKSTQTTRKMLAGALDTVASTITSKLKLFKSVNIPFSVKAADKFGNPIAGYLFKWDATAINTNPTNKESYLINGVTLTTTWSDQILAATDANGITTFNVSIPTLVDLNDGIQIKLKTGNGTYLASNILYQSKATDKQIYVDKEVQKHEWSFGKTAQSDNFILFWGNLAGTDPLHPANGIASIAFDPISILSKLENYLALYVDSFGFINNKNTGNMSRFKFPVVITDTWDNGGFAGGYATGGSTDGIIGSMWVHPVATGGSGFVLAHEFAHMCQAMIPIQYAGKGIKDPADNSYNLGMFWESHANFMAYTATGDLAGANPQRLINTAMMHFSSTTHYYENNYFLQYLLDKYGMEVINQIWRNANQGMHPLTSFRTNKAYSQAQLNNEIGYYAMKNVTWDYSIHDKMTKIVHSQGYPVICREFTIPDTSRINPGWYVVPKEMAPADYGYTIIPLYPQENASKVTLNFSGFTNSPSSGAGWRYGFVAVDKSGTPRYSTLYSAISGEATFDINPTDSTLFLVVSGAPLLHHNYVWSPGWPKIYRYPYSFQITGANPAGYQPGYNSKKKDFPGAAHSNGGGWVSKTASVAATAFVGPNAQVLGSAKVTGTARIEDYAIVTDQAVISGNAVIKGNAMVGSTSKVRENATVEKSARVFSNSDIYGFAQVTGSAIVYNSSISGYSIVKDLAWLNGATLSGTVIIGGDAENFTTHSSGTYFQNYNLRNGDGLESHALNMDVNPTLTEYGITPSKPTNLKAAAITPNTAKLQWSPATDDSKNLYYLVCSGTTVIGKTKDTTLLLTGLTPETNYTYTVMARDAEGNQSLRSTVLTLTTDTLSSEKPTTGENGGFQFYPNPATETLTIEGIGVADLKIVDGVGKCVYQQSISGKTTIPIHKIGKTGIYLIQITSGKTTRSEKLIIQSK